MTHLTASLSPTNRAPVFLSKQITPPRHADAAAQRRPAQTLVQRKANCPCGGGCPRCEAAQTLQAKLEEGGPGLGVSRHGDASRRGAERAADNVTHTTETQGKDGLYADCSKDGLYADCSIDSDAQQTPAATAPAQATTAAATCTAPNPKDFEVTGEQLFGNPKFEPVFSDEGGLSVCTRAPMMPFRWNAIVKARQPLQGCLEVGFLQTLRSASQAATYSSQTGGAGLSCTVSVPTPIRDAKNNASQPWFRPPVRMGKNCFADVVLPPGINPDTNETSVLTQDNPFTKWCIFLASGTQKSGSACGQATDSLRLSTVRETLTFDTWMVLRPFGSSDVKCFAFLRHASWAKSVEIVFTSKGTVGTIKRDLGIKVLDSGDGAGANKPELGSQTANDASKRTCV